MRRLVVGCLIGLMAVAPSGCALVGATSFGFAILSGKRVVDLSGAALRAQPGETLTAVNLATGETIARTSLGGDRRYAIQLSLPPDEPLAIALVAPRQAALLLTPTPDQRHETREQNLTAGSTAVAWGLGSAVGGIPVPSQGEWTPPPAQWKLLAARLPATHGLALQSAASVLDAAGVGNPSTAASDLSAALLTRLSAVRTTAGGHPRHAAVWPPLLLGWSDALHLEAQATGDLLGANAAAHVDVATVVDRIWAHAPYAEEQGGLEVRVPLRETGTQRVPTVLPDAVMGLRYRIEGSLLTEPREGEIPRAWLRFEGGDLILRVPDMPLGYAKAKLEVMGENGVILGLGEKDAQVAIAQVTKLSASPVEVSLGALPSPSTPGAQE